jgi:hypothetical protein
MPTAASPISAALADEAVRVHTHQRIRLRRGHRLHPAQAVFEAGTDGLTEGHLVHRQQRLDLPRRQRDHRRCLALVERQQRHRAAVAEPLPGGVVMVALDLHAAHQHRLAEVAHLRADAEHAAAEKRLSAATSSRACSCCRHR